MVKRLHICFNVISDPNWHAGNIYIFNCLQAISLLPQAERDKIKLSLATRKVSDIPQHIIDNVDQVYTETFFHLIFYKLLKLLPSWLRLSLFNYRKIDFYYPGGNLPKKWIFKWGGWIPDFQYRYLPQLFSEKEYNLRESRSVHAASQAPIIAFSSKCAQDDYKKFFPEYVGNEFLLRFVSNASADWLKHNAILTVKKFNLPSQYFVVCNQFWKHKDHGTVIEAIALLKLKGINITVVCTGATDDFRNPDYYPSLIAKAKNLNVEEQLIILGFISRQDQIQLIRGSLAIIQPSLFEGWSTVVEDGRALGKTIFLSDFPVHLEQNPPYSFFFEQKNPQQLASLITANMNDLVAGPDFDREKLAFQQNQQLMIEFGKKIIEMAQSIQ
jgi:glycosyltransferase involved in cell wall biosynthesis